MKPHDLTDQTFGDLTVLGRAENSKDGRSRWHVRCLCGVQKTIRAKDLVNGDSKSCGCRGIRLLVERNFRHGAARGTKRKRTYNIWRNMWQRCTNAKRKDYEHYGARGIMVCEEWMRYENFVADMGECPDGMSIDRINVDGNYEKENCRWADAETQARNKRIR